MDEVVIAYDLGTGGIKSSVVCVDGRILASTFVAYATSYSSEGWQEQAPEDWWNALVQSTRRLLELNIVSADSVRAIAISGHSLGVVPIGADGQLLRRKTPIWSDMRAIKEAEDFFQSVDYHSWYEITGNGFPPACYSLFKIAWYKRHEPEMYAKIDKVIGTKDYCNFRLTGRLCTDYSYASGCGAFSLTDWNYREDYMRVLGVSPDIFPEIIPSDAIVGKITSEAACETGLPESVQVVCGGVDNSCMALGAKGTANGRVYTSLGSSAWIALVADKPVLDFKYKPYVFAHVIKGMYASATCIFSAGLSQQWVRNTFCVDFVEREKAGGENAYECMNRLVGASVPGAHGVLFNPSLAGGSMMEPTPDMTGAFFGLRLEHTRADILRATQEGIAMNLRIALDVLRRYYVGIERMLIVGGGAKSPEWMQIFADIYQLPVEKTSIDQEAASLGAAALAFNGIGLWNGYEMLDRLHQVERVYMPREEVRAIYDLAQKRFEKLVISIAEINKKQRSYE